MFTLEKIIEDLDNGYALTFMYMNTLHDIMSFNKNHYVITKHTKDMKNTRDTKSIVNVKILKEMYNDMKEITYLY